MKIDPSIRSPTEIELAKQFKGIIFLSISSFYFFRHVFLIDLQKSHKLQTYQMALAICFSLNLYLSSKSEQTLLFTEISHMVILTSNVYLIKNNNINLDFEILFVGYS